VSRAKAGVLVALLSVGLIGGCGGGEPKKQTKDQFIAEADVVCAGVADDVQRKGATEPTTPEEIAQANNVLADAYGKLADGLSEIELPVGADRAGARAYIDSVRRTDPLLDKLRSSGKALVDAVNGADRQALADAGNGVRSALDGFRKARADSDLLAVRYGLNVCGNLG
jgi:hypothetical protein